MKNLYVFGDSFSTNFSTINEVSIEESWPVLLSNKLGYKLNSFASPGISNYGILNSIYKNLIFDENDVVIIGITFYDRLYDFWKDIGVNVDDRKTTDFNETEMQFYKSKIVDLNGMLQYTYNSLLQYDFIIKSLIKTKNVYFWNMDKCGLPLFNEMVKKYDKNYIKPNGYDCWIDFCNHTPSWWQKNNDRHFGKMGHKEFFEYLYQYIQPNLI